MRHVLSLATAITLGSLLGLAPATGEEPKPVKIGIVTNCIAEYWSICEAGASKAAKDHKVELLFRAPDKGFDVSVQTLIIEAWAEKGFQGIGVVVIDPQGQTENLKSIAKKVPLLTMDNDAPDSGRICFIGIDNYEAGKAAGRLVKKAIPNGGTVAIFIGSTKSAAGRGRVQGVLDELAGEKEARGKPADHPTDANIKCKQFGKYLLVDGEAREDGGPDRAGQHATATLRRLNGIKDVCLVGLYSYNPLAIVAAAREQKVIGKVKIVGFDEDWATLNAIAKGEIEATVIQDPFMDGYRAVESLAAKARGDNAKITKEPIPYRIVTKDGGPDEKIGGTTVKNLKATDYEKQLREWLKQSRK